MVLSMGEICAVLAGMKNMRLEYNEVRDLVTVLTELIAQSTRVLISKNHNREITQVFDCRALATSLFGLQSLMESSTAQSAEPPLFMATSEVASFYPSDSITCNVRGNFDHIKYVENILYILLPLINALEIELEMQFSPSKWNQDSESRNIQNTLRMESSKFPKIRGLDHRSQKSINPENKISSVLSGQGTYNKHLITFFIPEKS